MQVELEVMDCTYYRHQELQATEAGCPFCHPTSPRIVNLCGGYLTPSVIEFIRDNVADGLPLLITNYTLPPKEAK